jgi:hypothetical protein
LVHSCCILSSMQHRIKFQLGRLVATPGALEALEESSQSALDFVQRHQAGDWGQCDKEDAEANDVALTSGGRIFSVYKTLKGVKLWVITEADRSSTCVLLPSDY